MVYRKKTYKRKTNTNRSLKSRRRKGGEETGDIPRLLEEGQSPNPPPVKPNISNPPYNPVKRPNSPVSFTVPSPAETGPNLVGGRRRRKSKTRKTRKTRKSKGNKKVKKTYKKNLFLHLWKFKTPTLSKLYFSII